MREIKEISPDKMLILAYLYGELEPEKKQAFETRLKQDQELKQALEAQQQLHQALPVGAQPIINERRANAVRWSLQRRLRKSTQPGNPLLAGLTGLWQSQVSFKLQLVSMLLTFVLGVIMTQSWLNQDLSTVTFAESSQRALPLEMIQNDDFEIIDLQLTRTNPDSDEVEVSYSLLSETQVSGSLASKKIQDLFAATMKDEVNDATRLDLIDILKDYSQSSQAREALSYSLLNDPNPGVRMVAAQSLAKLSHEASIREVLRHALQDDLNAGIRVEVFEALIQHLDDQKTLDTFRNYSAKDSNQYIRSEARSLLKKASTMMQSKT